MTSIVRPTMTALSRESTIRSTLSEPDDVRALTIAMTTPTRLDDAGDEDNGSCPDRRVH